MAPRARPRPTLRFSSFSCREPSPFYEALGHLESRCLDLMGGDEVLPYCMTPATLLPTGHLGTLETRAVFEAPRHLWCQLGGWGQQRYDPSLMGDEGTAGSGEHTVRPGHLTF